MAIDLSTLTFTNQADIVPSSGTTDIINTGTANTLGGNDSITGDVPGGRGISNSGTINTGVDDDTLTGTTFISGTGIFNDTSAVIDKSVKHVGLKCIFLFSFELLDRNRHFGGNLSAHIFTKLKYVLKA